MIYTWLYYYLRLYCTSRVIFIIVNIIVNICKLEIEIKTIKNQDCSVSSNNLSTSQFSIYITIIRKAFSRIDRLVQNVNDNRSTITIALIL